MEFHEVAGLFPLLVGDDYEEFKSDIAANGLLEPIWIYEDKIIDGRNRYRACKDLGIEPKFREWNEDCSLVTWVISMNAKRRHLTKSQRAACAVLALPELEREAAERREKLGKYYRDQQIGVAEKIPEPQETAESREIAGQALDVNERYVSDAKKISVEDPDLFADLYAGDISLPQAKRKLREKREREISLSYEVDDQELFENYEELAWAIIVRAVLEAVEFPSNLEPREWLKGDDCRWYCERLGKTHDVLVDWVDTGCPATPLHIQMLNMLEKQCY